MPTKPTAGRLLRALLLCLMTALSLPATAQSDDADLDELIERIISLRGEVEDIDAELATAKSEHESRMSSLARREGELEAERQRAERQVAKLEDSLADTREAISEAGVDNEALVPVLKEAIAAARDGVERRLPFKRGERLASLDELETQLGNEALDPPRVANRLWSFHADEMRLAEESGLYRQSVTIDGEERLVDVVRLGMMMLYYRDDSGRYGYAERDGDAWRFTGTDERAAIGRIDTLFDAMRKQIRAGFFRLPNTLDFPEAQ